MDDSKTPLTSGQKKEVYFSSYTVVIAAFLVTVAGGMAIFSFGIFFKPISVEFGWTRTEISGAFSLAIILSGFLGIVTGRLGDRFKPRLIIIFCGTVQGLAYLLLSQINSLWQLYFFFGLLVGIGVANATPVLSLITRSYTTTRGMMMGITMAGGGVGAVVAAPVATYFISAIGWQSSYLVMGGIMLGLIAISAFFLYWSGDSRQLKGESIPSTQEVNPTVKEQSLREAAYSIRFWIFGAIIFCTGFIQMIVIVHIVPGATDMGISATGAAGILSLINLASIAGSSSSGPIIDRIGSWLGMVIALILMLIGLFLLLTVRDLWAFYVFAVIYGFGWGIVVTSRSIIPADLFGLHSYGSILGIILFLYTIGGTLGPVIAGYIFDVSQHYQLAFILITCLCALSIAMTFLLRRGTRTLR